MNNWIKGLLIAVMAIGVGIGQLDASPRFEQRQPVVSEITVVSEMPVDAFLVQRSSSGGFSGGSRSSGGSFSSGSRSSSGGFGSSSSRSSGGFSSSSRSSSSSSRSSSGGFGSSSSKHSAPSTSRSSSGGFSSSSSKPKSSSSSSVSPSKPSTGWFSGGSSSKPTTVKPSNSTASSVANKVNSGTKSSGKSYSSKESAVATFKADNAKETAKGGKYTSYYASEPATRPSHIPTTYNNHTVVYNPSYGGYGYWSGGGPGLGTWMMYDMMMDAAMLNAVSHNHGYYHQPTVVYTSSGGFPYVFLIGFTVLVLVVGLIVVIGGRNRG